MEIEETQKFLHDGVYEVLIRADEISEKVAELGAEISEDYRGKHPILIAVLNGGFIFCADLFRKITIDCEVDFIKISSYADAMETSGTVKLLKDIDAHLRDRHVIVVEDIVDSGYSIQFLREKISATRPRSLKFVSLLVKEEAARANVEIDYVGFTIPNRFVVGYGLDLAQKLRNLPHIYLVD